MSARILVVDDEERIRMWLESVLDRAGYEVILSDNAEDAFRRVALDSFDIVLTDLNMPGLNGLEGIRAIRVIRSDQKIAVLTGYATDQIKEQAYEAGADVVLFKPVRLEELNRVMTELVGQDDSKDEPGE